MCFAFEFRSVEPSALQPFRTGRNLSKGDIPLEVGALEPSARIKLRFVEVCALQKSCILERCPPVKQDPFELSIVLELRLFERSSAKRWDSIFAAQIGEYCAKQLRINRSPLKVYLCSRCQRIECSLTSLDADVR